MTPDIPTHSFKSGKATITVRQEVGWDVSDSRVIWRKLIASGVVDPLNELDAERAWGDFIPALNQTVSVDGDLGFPFPSKQGSAEDLGAAYTAFGKRAHLVGAYRTALREVEKLTPGEPEVLEKKDATGATPEPPSASPLTTGSPNAAATPTNSPR